jgi:hypothetical protein
MSPGLVRQERAAPAGRVLRAHWSASFKHVPEPGEVGCDGSRVSPEALVAHARGAAQREHHLAAAAVRDHAHRVAGDFP